MRAEREAEFETFVAAVSDRMFRTAYAITRDHQLAEDAVQSALASAYAKWRRVSSADQPEAYVRRMVVNEVIGWRRRRSSTERPYAEPPDRAADISSEDRIVETDAVWGALGQLAPRQRAVVVLRYYEHLSEAEIADVLGIRPGTVKSQCSAALANLRRILEPAAATKGEHA